MNRQQFLSRLAAELRKLPKEEIEAALEYYNEYFDEAGPEREQEVIAELGKPEQVAKQIKADYAIRWMELDDFNHEGNAKRPRRGVATAVVWVILGIFAAPVALSFAIGIGAVVFALIITIVALAVAGMGCLAAFVVCGGAMIVLGIGGLLASFSSALMMIGAGLVFVGVSAALFFAVGIAAKSLIRATLRWSRGVIERRRMKKMEKGAWRND